MYVNVCQCLFHSYPITFLLWLVLSPHFGGLYLNYSQKKICKIICNFGGTSPKMTINSAANFPMEKPIATHGGPMAPWAASRRDFARCRAAARGRPSSKDLGRSQIGIACMYIIYGAYAFFYTFNAMCQWVSKSGRPLVILGVEYGEGETFLNLYSLQLPKVYASSLHRKFQGRSWSLPLIAWLMANFRSIPRKRKLILLIELGMLCPHLCIS